MMCSNIYRTINVIYKVIGKNFLEILTKKSISISNFP